MTSIGNQCQFYTPCRVSARFKLMQSTSEIPKCTKLYLFARENLPEVSCPTQTKAQDYMLSENSIHLHSLILIPLYCHSQQFLSSFCLYSCSMEVFPTSLLTLHCSRSCAKTHEQPEYQHCAAGHRAEQPRQQH